MKAVLELELVGDGVPHSINNPRPWVARILGPDEQYGLEREFVHRQATDYTRANSVGSRGVYAYYALGPGLYEIQRPIRQRWLARRSFCHVQTERYFIQVEATTIRRVSREEAMEWLKNNC